MASGYCSECADNSSRGKFRCREVGFGHPSFAQELRVGAAILHPDAPDRLRFQVEVIAPQLRLPRLRSPPSRLARLVLLWSLSSAHISNVGRFFGLTGNRAKVVAFAPIAGVPAPDYAASSRRSVSLGVSLSFALAARRSASLDTSSTSVREVVGKSRSLHFSPFARVP